MGGLGANYGMEMGLGSGMGSVMAAGGSAHRPSTLTVAQLKAQEAEKKAAQEPNKKKGIMREAAGQRWRDPTLDEWPENDFRIFVGDMVSASGLCHALHYCDAWAHCSVSLVILMLSI